MQVQAVGDFISEVVIDQLLDKEDRAIKQMEKEAERVSRNNDAWYINAQNNFTSQSEDIIDNVSLIRIEPRDQTVVTIFCIPIRRENCMLTRRGKLMQNLSTSVIAPINSTKLLMLSSIKRKIILTLV